MRKSLAALAAVLAVVAPVELPIALAESASLVAEGLVRARIGGDDELSLLDDELAGAWRNHQNLKQMASVIPTLFCFITASKSKQQAIVPMFILMPR